MIIPLELSAARRVRITIHDRRGAAVRTLVDAALPAGYHRITWDGRDGKGEAVASGVYGVRSSTGERRTVVLMR